MIYNNIEVAPLDYEFETKRFNDAIMYCFALSVDGVGGWRLPTKEELAHIYESDNDFATHTSDGHPAFYMTSTKCGDEGYIEFKKGYHVWFRSFNDGSGSYFSDEWIFCFKVRPVRDLRELNNVRTTGEV